MLDQMKAEFEKWHGYSVNDDMDIHTAVAWDSWRIAWNAGAMAATVGLPELPTCTKSQTATSDEIYELIEGAANMMRGMTLDPAIPQHAKGAMREKIQELEKAMEELLIELEG